MTKIHIGNCVGEKTSKNRLGSGITGDAYNACCIPEDNGIEDPTKCSYVMKTFNGTKVQKFMDELIIHMYSAQIGIAVTVKGSQMEIVDESINGYIMMQKGRVLLDYLKDDGVSDEDKYKIILKVLSLFQKAISLGIDHNDTHSANIVILNDEVLFIDFSESKYITNTEVLDTIFQRHLTQLYSDITIHRLSGEYLNPITDILNVQKVPPEELFIINLKSHVREKYSDTPDISSALEIMYNEDSIEKLINIWMKNGETALEKCLKLIDNKIQKGKNKMSGGRTRKHHRKQREFSKKRPGYFVPPK